MKPSSITEELRQLLESGDFRITVVIGNATYLCFLKTRSANIFRLEGNLITYHATEVSPELDCEEIELYCLHIEEQYAADNNSKDLPPHP